MRITDKRGTNHNPPSKHPSLGSEGKKDALIRFFQMGIAEVLGDRVKGVSSRIMFEKLQAMLDQSDEVVREISRLEGREG